MSLDTSVKQALYIFSGYFCFESTFFVNSDLENILGDNLPGGNSLGGNTPGQSSKGQLAGRQFT